MSLKQQLYGGHFTIELINGSDNYVDASTIREVPDNQEVFVGKHDDTSILIDLLEKVPESDLIKAMEYHLEDIMYDLKKSIIKQNDQVLHNDTIRDNIIYHRLSILTEDECRDMYFALIRLDEFETDIIITYNPPSTHNADANEHERDLKTFVSMVKSFTLVDKSIFG
ncbi:uncharacterized protein HGUI_02973 [Hanseniaspora guilliermondii]|uniref:Nuclear import protein MOG1 n=1 Tax=Hanseniaspora guilliermondii TaxID=56406 RepID=A0A1L0CPB3_9ASCO|nr:uncharacterized protein HGUI_02973 [Hanseniaspora guilliermondii]